MTEPYPWYGTASGEPLEQGDFLRSCPNYQIDTQGRIGVATADVILLSHSCDLANDKLEVVQVCPHWPLELLATRVEFLRSRRGREELRRGKLTGYHLLNRCDQTGFERDFVVVDFRSVYGVSLAPLKELAKQQSPAAALPGTPGAGIRTVFHASRPTD
jgi:hypothetical protein